MATKNRINRNYVPDVVGTLRTSYTAYQINGVKTFLMTRVKQFILFVIAACILILISCTRTIYNVEYSAKKPNCDTTSGQLYLRIINTGKFGISSMGFNTESGQIKYGGLMPNDTTCYFPIPPVYNRPGYKIYILRFNNFGQANGISLIGTSIDHIGDAKFTSGYCTLTIALKKIKGKFKVDKLLVSKD
jgi:hypothetical protein